MITQSCPLCGGVMREQVSGCATCPVGPGCTMICCESCGYETVPARSRTWDVLRRILVRLGVLHETH